jgi:hypothetical protein
MNKCLLLVGLATCTPAPPTDVETSVHKVVREVMAEEDGRVDFSDLHNNHELTADELAYLDRLYEVFFALPTCRASFGLPGKSRPSRTSPRTIRSIPMAFDCSSR